MKTLDEDCESYFSYSPDGEIHTNTNNGEYTVELLGLNSYALKQARAAKYKAYLWCDEETIKWYLEPHDGKLEPFVNILEYFYREGFYSAKIL